MLHPGLRDAASKGCESLQVILCEAMLRSHAEFGTAQSANHRHDDYRITAAVGPLSFVASKHLFTDDLRQSQQGEQNVNVHGCFKMSFCQVCVYDFLSLFRLVFSRNADFFCPNMRRP